MQIDNVHENEHVLRMSQHLCELLPDQRGRNTWAVFQSRNVIPFSPGWLLFPSWILIASNILGSWSTKRNILARKDLSLATLSGWTFFDEFITAEIVAVSRRYYATSAGFVLCVAQLAKGLVWGSTGSQHDLRHNTGSLSLSARQMHLASFVNVASWDIFCVSVKCFFLPVKGMVWDGHNCPKNGTYETSWEIPYSRENYPLVNVNSLLLKMAIYSWFSH